MKTPLSSFKKDLIVEIVDIEAIPESNRLKSMGFVSGTVLKVVKSGNPFLVKIANTSIGLSKELASSIIVTESHSIK